MTSELCVRADLTDPEPAELPATTQIALIGAGPLSWSLADPLLTPDGPTWIIVDSAEPHPELRARAGAAPTAGHALSRLLRRQLSSNRRTVRAVSHWTELDQHTPDFAVVATSTVEPDRGITEYLVRFDIPHLIARLATDTVRIGPLVLPGRTPCLNCVDTLLTDTDPGWPKQLFSRMTQPCGPVNPLLRNWGAAVAAVQTRSFLATGHADALGCTVELDTGDLLTRVRHWPRHPDCGCSWWESQ